LFGQEMMTLPVADDIVYLGRLTEAEKTEVIKDARVVVQPSPFESFSINTLESLLLEVPVVVNAQSEVLKGHCLRSRAGLYYNDFSEFETALTRLLSDDSLRQGMGKLGRAYVETEYDWDIIADKYLAFLGRIKADL
jgi:glycosyltransferase involved in cell wall biosynthesis